MIHVDFCCGSSPPKSAESAKTGRLAKSAKPAKPAKPAKQAKSAKHAPKSKAKQTSAAATRRKIKIEPNIEIDDTISDDAGYMDTHFGDSDEYYDMGNSDLCQPSTSSGAVSNASKAHAKATAKSRRKQSTSAANVPPHIIPIPISEVLLQECAVVLEQIDLSLYAHMMNQTTSVVEPTSEMNDSSEQNDSIANESDQQFEIVRVAQGDVAEPSSSTVPPITLRIKKEALNSDYGDELDPEMARSIKEERVDEMWELAGPSTSNPPAHKKKSKKRNKRNKVYKKPALLAVKIKEERVDYDEYAEDNVNQINPPQSEVTTSRSTRLSIDRSLPIITQIHSNIGANGKSKERATTSSMVLNPAGMVHAARAKMVHTPMIRVKTEPIDEAENEIDAVPEADFTPVDTTVGDVPDSVNPNTIPVAEQMPSTSGNEPIFGVITSVESQAHAIHARIKLERVTNSDSECIEGGEQFELNEMSLAPEYEQYIPDICGDFGQESVENEQSDEIQGCEMSPFSALPEEAPTISQTRANDEQTGMQCSGLIRIAGFATFQETANIHENQSTTTDSGDIMPDDELLEAPNEATSIPNNTTTNFRDNDTGSLQIAEFADFKEIENLHKNQDTTVDDDGDNGIQNLLNTADNFEEAVQIPECSLAVNEFEEEIRGIKSTDANNSIDSEESSKIPENEATDTRANSEILNNPELVISDGAIPIDKVNSPQETNEMSRVQADELSPELPYTNEQSIENSSGDRGRVGVDVKHDDDISNNVKLDEHLVGNEQIPNDNTENEEISGHADETLAMLASVEASNNTPASPHNIVDVLMNIESTANEDIISTANFDIHSMDDTSQDNLFLDTIDEFVRGVANEMITTASPSPPPPPFMHEGNLQPSIINNENNANSFALPAFMDTFEPAAKANDVDIDLESTFNDQLNIESNASIDNVMEPLAQQNTQQTLPNTEEVTNTNEI